MKRKTLFVTVCKNVILANLKNGRNDPPVRIACGKSDKNPRRVLTYETYGRIRIMGDMTKKKLPWGARVWVEIEESQV